MSRFSLIDLPKISDERGSLSFAQEGSHIPFIPYRIFYIYDVVPDASRGGHAHRQQEQFLFVPHGRCRVVVDDGIAQADVLLDRPTKALYAPAGLWLELKDFSKGAVCVTLSSGHFDEADYIRSYAEFIALTQSRRNALCAPQSR